MNNRTHSTASFSLVEVTLALGVAAFCLIAVFGMMPVGLKTNQTSIRQTTANGILSAIVADLRATPVALTQSNLFKITFQQDTTLCCDGNGACSISSGGSGGGESSEEDGGGSGTSGCANAIFLATVTFSSSGGGSGDDGDESGSEGGTTASFAHVKVTWPYSAAAAAAGDNDGDEGGGGSTQPAPTPAGYVETFVGLDRNGGTTSGESE